MEVKILHLYIVFTILWAKKFKNYEIYQNRGGQNANGT